MCKRARRTPGTAEREASVAEMLASVTRRTFTTGPAFCAYSDPSYSLFPGDRSRESCGTWQLPQITTKTTPKTTTTSARTTRTTPMLLISPPP